MVQTTAYDPMAAPADPYGLLEGGRKAISFASKDANGFTVHAPIGTQFTGLISGDLRRSQIINFETKRPEFWPDNRPKEQIVVDLQTDERDDELDDGIRTLYVKGQMLADLQEKLRATRHLGRIGEGTRLTVTLIAYKDSGKGNPQKIYQVDVGPEFVAFVPPEQRQVNAALGYAQPVQPAAPQYAPQVQPAAPQYVQPQQVAQPVAPQAVSHYAPPITQPQAAQPAYVAPQVPVQAVVQQPVAPPVAQPQAAQPVSPARAALDAIAAQPVAAPQPAAPQPAEAGVAITQEHVDAYAQVTAAGIDPQTAIQSLTQRVGGGSPEFAQALAAAVGVGA